MLSPRRKNCEKFIIISVFLIITKANDRNRQGKNVNVDYQLISVKNNY